MTLQQISRLMGKISETAPVVSLAAVLVLPLLLSHDPAQVPIFGPEQARVARAIDNAPFRIGRWVGSDIPVPEAAVRMLRPNAMLSRRFTDMESGSSIDLLIVHCTDARDMLGHYPPVCYPNAGWVYDGPNPAARRHDMGEPVQIRLDNRTFTAQMYRFSRMRDWTSQSEIRIFNFFVLPDGSLTHNIHEVSERTNWLGGTIHGVAQVQFVQNARVLQEDTAAAVEEILSGLREIFGALGVVSDD